MHVVPADSQASSAPAERGPDATPAAGLLEALRAGRHREIDLKGVDLRGQDLSGLDLSGADLAGACLTGAKLSGAKLSFSRLTGIQLQQADLDDCELLGSDLSGADLTECSAERAGFGGADLTRALLTTARLSGATLSQAKASRADFGGANLHGARLRECDLIDTDLTRADLTQCDLQRSNVRGASFHDADLRGASIGGLVGFATANWIGADTRDVNFRGAHLIRRHIEDENYLDEFRNQSRASALLYRVWWLTSDCGRSFSRWALFTGALALLFAGLFALVEIDYGPNRTIVSPLYFSVVTLTTLGYGDALPVTIAAQIVVMAEVITGYMALGGLLSVFATKMARRAE